MISCFKSFVDALIKIQHFVVTQNIVVLTKKGDAMNTLKIFAILIVLSNPSFSQIDTTIWYPLQLGNKWQYSDGLIEIYYYSVEVIGDTIMPNEKTYQILDEAGNIRYQRNEDNKYVYEYNQFDSTEILLYDFISPDRTIWKSKFDYYYYGVQKTERDYSYLPNIESTWKLFDLVQIDSSVAPPDTIFGAMIDVFPTQITKGIGVTSYSYGIFSGLSGAIINGDTLGTITSIKDKSLSQNSYHIFQNYPNPFNPSTNIEFSIPKEEFVELNIYNSLGQIVKNLINGIIPRGNHIIRFEGEGFSSGIYFYQLKTKNYSNIKKMLLLK